jgi:hypothetical protein
VERGEWRAERQGGGSGRYIQHMDPFSFLSPFFFSAYFLLPKGDHQNHHVLQKAEANSLLYCKILLCKKNKPIESLPPKKKANKILGRIERKKKWIKKLNIGAEGVLMFLESRGSPVPWVA